MRTKVTRGFVGYSREELTVGWTDPVNIVPTGLLVVALSLYGIPRTKAALWALVNAVLIHSWMDGIIGAFGRGPLWLVNEYTTLDSRFWPTQESTVMGLAMFELFVMAPLAFSWYGAIQKSSWYQHWLCLVVGSFHMMGDFMYMFGEAWDGFKHLPMEWPPQFNTYYEFKYFWFVFIGLNLVWFVIPLTLMCQSIAAMDPEKQQMGQDPKKEN